MHYSACGEINYLCNLGHLQRRYRVPFVANVSSDREARQTKRETEPRRDDWVEHLSWTGKSDHDGWVEWDSESKMEPEGEADRDREREKASCKHRLRIIYSQG